MQEDAAKRLEARTPPGPPPGEPKKPVFLTPWKNMLTPEELQLYNDAPSKREELKARGESRLAEKKDSSVGGRKTRRRKHGRRMKSKTHKKGGYVAVYKKSSRRSSSKSKKTRSKRSSGSSKGRKSKKR